MELKLDRLTRQYGAKIAVDRVSAALGPGLYGLLGANGAGKTTLMRMLCGILRPTSGEVTLDGRPIREMGEAYRDMLGYLPQDFGCYPDYTAREYLLYIAVLKGLPRPEALHKADELLERVGLAGCGRQKIRGFSGGMRQRLGIAQAMLNDPYILVLDEPTAGLDPKERVRFRNLLSDFASERIVLLSTHIVSDVESAAGKVFLMKDGAFVLEGDTLALTRKAVGKVWECTVPPQQAAQLEARFCVAGLRRGEQGVTLRIVKDGPPLPDAQPCIPTLEDLYLYYFEGEGGGAR